VNDWVLGGDGDLDVVARDGITYGFGHCEETRSLLRWLRAWNESHDRKVRFYGMDLPAGSGSMEPGVVYALAFLDRVDPEYATSFRDEITPLIDAFRRENHLQTLLAFNALSQAERERLLLLTTELAGRMSSGRALYAQSSSPEEAELALRAAINARQAAISLQSGAYGAQPHSRGAQLNPRDAAMRENVEWILQREDRLIIAAHNGHIQRAPLVAGPHRSNVLGEHLAALDGLSMVVIGTTYASGEIVRHDVPPNGELGQLTMRRGELPPPPPNSLDTLLDQAGADVYLLDLRQVPSTGPVADAFSDADSMLVSENALPVNPLVAFDAIVHVRRVSLAEVDGGVWSDLVRPR
jgi:erythromycin esterase